MPTFAVLERIEKILTYIDTHPEEWITIRALSEALDIPYSTVAQTITRQAPEWFTYTSGESIDRSGLAGFPNKRHRDGGFFYDSTYIRSTPAPERPRPTKKREPLPEELDELRTENEEIRKALRELAERIVK